MALRFPRLQKRGPIEASGVSPTNGGQLGFHAYKSVAPLKRYLSAELIQVDAWFPRLQKRGPIEASSANREGQGSCSFHAYKSVAPLKLRGWRGRGAGGNLVSTLTKAWPH